MLILTNDGIKAEVMAKQYAVGNEGAMKYIVRTHAGVIFAVEAKACHVILDESFEPFKQESQLTPNLGRE